MSRQIPARSHGARTTRAERSYIAREAVLPIERFIHSETAGAVVLLAAAAIAISWANSPWSAGYFAFWKQSLGFHLGPLSLARDLQHWINEGLMAIFFFVVGLEIKRELVQGELSGFKKAMLPAVAALGGMAAPACIYLALNPTGAASRGWGIPMATDIAFAVGVMSLLGRRVPSGLKVFLLALAIADDLGAILVIALFYTRSLSLGALLVAVLLIGAMILMRRLGIRNAIVYTLAAVAFWSAVLASGIHATIAGVVLGFLVPVKPWFSHEIFADAAPALLNRFRLAQQEDDPESAEDALGQLEELTYGTESAAQRLERAVHPWVSYLVLPLFALANAGVVLSAEQIKAAGASPVMLGVACGLVLGKPIGIVVLSWLAVRLRLASLPDGVTWIALIGMGVLAGIGFTVSLFISNLAFGEGQLISDAKIGILAASLVAGICGICFLRALRLRPGSH